MNCDDCQENLVANLEGVLDPQTAADCRRHVEGCPACKSVEEATFKLRQELLGRGRAAAQVSMVGSVMSRIRDERPKQAAEAKPDGGAIFGKLFARWALALGTAAAAIALMIVLALPRTQATAAEVLAKGAQAVAKLTSIHFRGQLRTYPADNFSYINPDADFCTIELWEQFQPELKWRAEKPGRVLVMNGRSTVMLIKTDNSAVKLPQRTTSAFDTEWLHRIANLSKTINNELNNARAKGWKLDLAEGTGADGALKSIVTIMAKSDVPDNDYVKNSFFENADTRRVYTFDKQSGLLETVQIYLTRPSGEVKIFDIDQIDYNQAIDASIWNLELPADVTWVQLEPPKLPDNQKYASMTAEQAARAFLEACANEDWNEAGKFMSPITPGVKQDLGGLKIVSLGKPFTSTVYPGVFVPYEIELRPQEINVRVSNANAAKRCVVTGIYDSKLHLQQDLKGSTTEPETLSDNDADARLSPAQTVQAYFDAQSKFDWVEMRKFTSESDVENTKSQIEMAKKLGMDVQKLMPVVEVGQATWSAEQSAWFVKCSMSQTKKWNLAVRKDNPAGRWQIDGGI
jgi:hypothetical protein